MTTLQTSATTTNAPSANSNSTSKAPASTTTNPLALLEGKVVFLDLSSSYKLIKKLKECLNIFDVVSTRWAHSFSNIFSNAPMPHRESSTA
jgi:hypothetical protein